MTTAPIFSKEWLRETWTNTRWFLGLLLIAFERVCLLLLFVLILGSGQEYDPSLRGQVVALTRDHLFDYVSWEFDALWDKARQELFGVHSYLDDDARHAVVIDWLQKQGNVQRLETQITRVYADPTVPDPEAATRDLRAERDALRESLRADQRLVEGIIEEQVSAVLADEGFGLLGQILPPVSMHFTGLPMALIVSPRDRIAFATNVDLDPLPVETCAALEDTIDADLDVASLIVPLGGLSLYPSMIGETGYVPRAFEVTAHEWTHHYLMFFPLGLEYEARPETRIINETVATFLGRSVALEVMARYYPDLTPPVYPSFLNPTTTTDTSETPAHDPDAPEPFVFSRELYTTRVTVEWLLREGKVEAAERYMEYRRREFVRNGYYLRKLNQAYFAFYGGYQGSPGAGGADPIGPAVEELRSLTPDLESWLILLRGVTTRAELLSVLEQARADSR